MSSVPTPSMAEIESFARRYGLERLAPEHLARMAELAVYVSELGRGLPRPARKEDQPAGSTGPGDRRTTR